MAADIDSLAMRLALDVRITTRTLWRLLKDIDQQIFEADRMGEAVPSVIRTVRDVVAQAYVDRVEREQAGLHGDPADVSRL